MPLEVGSIVEGVVTGITHFGAFVTLPTGQTGLVHISEVADTYVRDIKEFIKEQDRIKVKVLSVDAGGKIGLSIRQVDPRSGPNRRGGGGVSRKTFEDKLTKFMKDSEDRLTTIKRATESKRGGRGSRRN
jgi:S1 RNA binding domain protein